MKKQSTVKTVIALLVIAVITIGAISVIDKITKVPGKKAETTENTAKKNEKPEDAQKYSEKEPETDSDTTVAADDVLLELTYEQTKDDVTSTATACFYGDGSFTCESVVSQMYIVEYSSTYSAEDGLKIETVDEYTSHCTEEAKQVVDLIGLPQELTFSIEHLVEENADGSAVLTIQAAAGDSEPAIVGVFEITGEQLQSLTDAMK